MQWLGGTLPLGVESIIKREECSKTILGRQTSEGSTFQAFPPLAKIFHNARNGSKRCVT